MYNLVILIGNLTKDPELRYLPQGTAVATFTLAVNRKYKHNDETKTEVYYGNIKVFGKVAENCSKYLAKGSSAVAEGRLTEESWEKDGKKHSKTVIVASNVKFLSRKKEGGQSESSAPEEVTDLEPF